MIDALQRHNPVDTSPSVRVRFAPSPTGHLHIGGLRAALFNWLFARHMGGLFLVRIEDTDTERSLPIYTESIIESLAWCTLEADEPLVFQSARREEHVRIAHDLVARGTAYRCYCTAQELQARLGLSAASGGYHHYDGACRDVQERVGQPYVIRCKVPQDRPSIVVRDLIHGEISFPIQTIDDFIIVRSDGSPMYNFVVVVDDAYMRISHVIRGDEHLVNTPRQILLYEACGYAIPAFAHVPLILAPDGSKLSKRFGATAVTDYKKAGYVADALCNYLVRLGWSHGDQEVFSRDEMIRLFTLEHVNKSGAVFDQAKLLWLNQLYCKQLAAPQLYALMVRDVDTTLPETLAGWPDEILYRIIELYKERIKTLVELRDVIVQLHVLPSLVNHPYVGAMSPAQWQVLELFVERVAQSDYTRDMLEILAKELCRQVSVKLQDFAQPVRLALTGVLTAPGIYDLLLALGKEESIRRIKAFIDLRVLHCQ